MQHEVLNHLVIFINHHLVNDIFPLSDPTRIHDLGGGVKTWCENFAIAKNSFPNKISIW